MHKFCTLTIAVAAMLIGASRAEAELSIVATLSTFADLAKTVGGEHVSTASVASPKFNPHFIEAKPSDVLRVKKADLFIHGGLDLEAWRGPLLDAAGNPAVRPGGAKELDASKGIHLLEVPDRTITRAEGDIHLFGNPHYWISPENARIIAGTIAAKLAEIDPSNAAEYQANLKQFETQLDVKITEWKSIMAPYAGQEIIGYHNEWPYLMQFVGLKMDKFLEPKPGIPPTPKQTEFLEGYMKANNVKVIVLTSYFPSKAADVLAARTGGKVALLAQGVGENKATADYISLIDYDIKALVAALGAK